MKTMMKVGPGIASAVAVTLLAVVLVAPAAAGPQRESRVLFDIEAQPLGDALRGLADQADIQVYYREDLVHGLQSDEVRGRLRISEALEQVLAPSGLRYDYADEGTVVIVAARSGGRSSSSGAAEDASETAQSSPSPAKSERQAPETLGSGEPSDTFYAPLEVPVVNVEILAVGPDGGLVNGLTADDFQVFEDGEPVEITHFFAAEPVEAEGRELQPVGGELGVLPVPESDRNLYLAIYVDQSTILPEQRRTVLEHLRQFLDGPLPEDVRLMLATYDGALRLRTDFETDPAPIRSAMESLARESGSGFARQEQLMIREMEQAAVSVNTMPGLSGQQGGTAPEDYLAQVRTLAQASAQRAENALANLEQFIELLAGVSGRKAILWVGGELNVQPGERMFRTWERLFAGSARSLAFNAVAESSRYSLLDELRQVARRAGTHRVSFYGLSGLASRMAGSVSAEFRDLGLSEGAGYNDPLAGEQSIGIVSEVTGGRVLTDSARLDEQLHEVAEELGSYYSLGYSPLNPGDGRYHEITVKVAREDVDLRYRQGYSDQGAGSQLIERTLAAVTLGVADNPMAVAVDVQDIEAKGDNAFLVPVMVRIPIGELVLLPQAGEHLGRVTIALAARDAEGRVSEVHNRQFPVRVPNQQVTSAVNQMAGFVMGMQMRGGDHRIAVSVRDDHSAVESTTFVDTPVAAEEVDG